MRIFVGSAFWLTGLRRGSSSDALDASCRATAAIVRPVCRVSASHSEDPKFYDDNIVLNLAMQLYLISIPRHHGWNTIPVAKSRNRSIWGPFSRGKINPGDGQIRKVSEMRSILPPFPPFPHRTPVRLVALRRASSVAPITSGQKLSQVRVTPALYCRTGQRFPVGATSPWSQALPWTLYLYGAPESLLVEGLQGLGIKRANIGQGACPSGFRRLFGIYPSIP